jgi:iron complex transport system permease protein
VTDQALRPSTVGATLASAVAARFALSRRRSRLLLVGAVVALFVAVVAGLLLGSVPIAPSDVVGILLHRLGLDVPVTWTPSAETIVIELRLPRLITALAVGCGLSLAGATLQGLLRNPLADPYVLGTSGGAALGAAIALLIPVQVALLGLGLVQVLAFAGALGAVAVVYRLSRVGALGSMTSVLLTGYAVGSLLAAGLAMTMYVAGNTLRQIFFYLLGSFSLASWQQLTLGLPLIVAGSALLLLRGRSLNALLLGEETASHLGIDVRRERVILLALASLVTASAVAMAGLIGFVGLIVPHAVRLLVGPNARSLLPISALLGAVFLCLADIVARVPGDVPVGIVTAVVGAPFFLYLLRRYRTGYQL